MGIQSWNNFLTNSFDYFRQTRSNKGSHLGIISKQKIAAIQSTTALTTTNNQWHLPENNHVIRQFQVELTTFETEALLDFYNSTNGFYWSPCKWNISLIAQNETCSFFGIQCNKQQNHVIEIN